MSGINRINIPEITGLPSSRADEVLQGDDDYFHPGINAPWLEDIEKMLQWNTVLNGIRGNDSDRVGYALSDVFPVGAKMTADVTVYRVDQSNKEAIIPVLINGVEGVAELIKGRAVAVVDGIPIQMGKNELIPITDNKFVFALTSDEAKIRVCVPFKK